MSYDVVDPGPIRDQPERITELWAWTAISAQHGTEGIIAQQEPAVLPLVCSTRRLADLMEPLARAVERKTGATVRLRRFVAAEGDA